MRIQFLLLLALMPQAEVRAAEQSRPNIVVFLADDMGLGKTLQSLTFVQKRGGRALVVCPSSLVSNWAAEVRKWTPELSYAEYVGGKRGELSDVDILITSYAILRIDAEKFHALEFDIAILDEAQQIKNPEAQISRAVHRWPPALARSASRLGC